MLVMDYPDLLVDLAELNFHPGATSQNRSSVDQIDLKEAHLGIAEECNELFGLANRNDQTRSIVDRNPGHLVITDLSMQLAAVQTQESTIEALQKSQSDARTVRGLADAICLAPSFAYGTSTFN